MKYLKFGTEEECVRFMEKRGWEFQNHVFYYGDIAIHISSAMAELTYKVLESLEHNAIERKKWLKQK